MKTMWFKYLLLIISLQFILSGIASASPSRHSAATHDKSEGFVLLANKPLHISCDTTKMEPVAKSALELLKEDCKGVLQSDIIVETAPTGKGILLSLVTGMKREAFRLQVNHSQLVIEASDGHGLAYGMLEVSRLLGVSPWIWWADTGYTPRKEFTLPQGYLVEKAPDVDFRGIFINDEDWGLMPWSSKTYEPLGIDGSIGPKTYSRVFELLLRLRANTIWPAMHECSQPFFLTPGNRETAARYGIYIGGSHCEPMACSTAVEWGRRGTGKYDYVSNSAEVRRFWEQRLKEVNQQEILYTLGMRGVHDGAMQGAKTIEERRDVLSRVLTDQRELLARWVNPDVTQIPQVFIPYKEVLEVYNSGLQVPEDVCLMWCDDNYGYIRHFPTPSEKSRKGGNGIYYHASYWGRPHDYLWLGTTSPYLMYQQLHKGYEKGIGRIWILNVGDIKPNEYETELFMDMAWDMKGIERQGIYEHMKSFYCRELGSKRGEAATEIMNEWHRLAFIRKPEHMAGTRVEESDKTFWSTPHDLPWNRTQIDERLQQYQQLSDKVEMLEKELSPAQWDTYFQLVKYPVQAAYQLNRKWLEAQLARHNEGDWNSCDRSQDSIKVLTERYNQGFRNEGKWLRMMDCQPRRLPVFGAVPHLSTDEYWQQMPSPLHHWNGDEAIEGEFIRCEGLGYQQRAIELIPNHTVSYGTVTSGTTLQLHLLPTHPIDGTRLGLWVQTGDAPAQWIDYRTQGRSEEWKQNVLRNQAIRSIPVSATGNLHLWTDCEGVVIDEITEIPTISSSEMRAIYEEVKTPYKYGVIMRAPRSGDMVDCPTVFREKNEDGTFGKWKMTYVLYDGRGYETWLAESDDLLHWNTLERVLRFPSEPKDGEAQPWDYHQRGGFPALQDMTWGGDYTIGTYQGKHWMTYIGSKKKGYEGVPISIGLASTTGDVTQPHNWDCLPSPILNYGDKDTLWWESYSPYKSCIYRTPTPLDANPAPLNSRFFMYYNASYQGEQHNKGERIGIATSDDMLNWKRYEGNPVFQHDHMGCITGDAHIQRVPFTNEAGRKDSLWVMFYFCAYNPEWKQYPAYNSFACSRDLLHWTDWTGQPLVVPSEYYDFNYSHKSCVIKHEGVVYHFYCAVDKDYRRTIALSTSRDLTSEGKIPLLPEDAAQAPLTRYDATEETDEEFGKAAWIALQQDDSLIIPGVHQPLIKKTFKDQKPGMYRLPLFKKEFNLLKHAAKKKSEVKEATLMVCGLGQFEAFINGEKVGNHFLDPAWSAYDKEAYYVKFDVTSQIAASPKGQCTLKIALGNGFYNIPRQGYAKLIQSYGAPKVKALLRICYTDGISQLIPTDDSWLVQQSPVYYSSIYGGESYDARLEQNKSWQKPVIAQQDIKLREQKQPVTYHGELTAKSVVRLNDSTVVYDFGQNCASILRIKVRGKTGDHVTLKPAELVYPDGRVHNTVAPKFHFDYIVGDTREHVWQPQFTYTGCRYVEVTQPSTTTLDISLVPVYAEMAEVGSFHSSDTLLNSIHSLIDWAIRSNTQSISTDCPTREKLGWLEQAYLMQESMMYRYDMTRLFPKIMDDMAAAQHANGCIPTIAPEYVDFGEGFGDTPEWGCAFIEVPWKYYEWYGDDSLIRKHYDQMARYIDYLTSRADSAGVVCYGLGDWYDIGPKAPGYSQLTTTGVTATATYYHEVKLMQKMSMMLGKRTELQKWSRLSKKIKADYNKAFLKISDNKTDSINACYDRNSQTANAISLCMGLVPDTLKESVRKALAEDIIAHGNTAGDIGYRYVLQALAKAGRNDLVYHIATTTEQPSYAYQLKKGATALTESWQALERVSNNHLMLGHLMQWLYGVVGGISQAKDSNGWNHIIINPNTPKDIGNTYQCETSLNTIRGTIRCIYSVTESGAYSYDVTVPTGCRATILLPSGPVEQTAGRKRYKYVDIIN